MGSTHTFNWEKSTDPSLVPVRSSRRHQRSPRPRTSQRSSRAVPRSACNTTSDSSTSPSPAAEENEPEPRRKDGLSGVSNRQSSPFLLFHFINSLPSAVCPTSRRGGWLGPRSSSL